MICIAFCMSRQNGTGCQLVGEMGVGKMGLTLLNLTLPAKTVSIF